MDSRLIRESFFLYNSLEMKKGVFLLQMFLIKVAIKVYCIIGID